MPARRWYVRSGAALEQSRRTVDRAEPGVLLAAMIDSERDASSDPTVRD